MFHELIPEGLSFLQLWSGATLPRGVVEDLTGVQVRADRYAVRLAPQLPAGWEAAELERLSVTHLSGPAPLNVTDQAPDGSEQAAMVAAGQQVHWGERGP